MGKYWELLVWPSLLKPLTNFKWNLGEGNVLRGLFFDVRAPFLSNAKDRCEVSGSFAIFDYGRNSSSRDTINRLFLYLRMAESGSNVDSLSHRTPMHSSEYQAYKIYFIFCIGFLYVCTFHLRFTSWFYCTIDDGGDPGTDGIDEVNRVFISRRCRDDRQLAFQVLGLQATRDNPNPVLPNEAAFIPHFNSTLRLISPPELDVKRKFKEETALHRASFAIGKVLDAAFAIADFDFEGWWQTNSWDKYFSLQITNTGHVQS